MNIVIVGAGAMGAIFGAALAQGGHNVSLLSRPSLPDAAPPHQLRVREVDGSITDLTGTMSPDASPVADADLVIVTVKTGDTHAAMERIRPHLQQASPILTLQNGLGAAERIRGVLGPEFCVLPGVTSQAALRREPDLVEHTGAGITVVGYSCDGDAAFASRIANVLTEAGLPAEAVSDIEREIWRKAAINAAINGLTALGGFPNGAIAEDPDLFASAVAIADEAASVARAHRVEPGDMREAVEAVVAATARNRSSMLQDVEAGRPTETDAIHGAIREAGKEAGVKTPAIDLLHTLISAKSRTSRMKEPPVD